MGGVVLHHVLSEILTCNEFLRLYWFIIGSEVQWILLSSFFVDHGNTRNLSVDIVGLD